MPSYSVNATLVVPAWLDVTADSPDAAEEIAANTSASDFEFDLHSATVEFNVSPAVEER